MIRRAAAALLTAALLSGCATPSLTLLPSAEGKQGAVAVLEEDNKPIEPVVVNELNSRTTLSGTPRTKAIESASLNERQQALLRNLPPPPIRVRLYFKPNTVVLTDESQPGLTFLKEEIARRPGAEVQVTGHTDSVGSDADNDALSEKRAMEVVKALNEQEGIELDLLTAVGRGEREPLENLGNNKPSALNRRVEVIVR